MAIEKIELLKRNENGKDCVFLIPFFLKEKIYKNYKEVNEDLKNKEIPLVLAQMRWDGKLGFIGGKVESNEFLEVALLREIKEEGLIQGIGDVIPLCSHRDNEENLHLHCFVYECSSIEEFKYLSLNSNFAEHFIAESGGLFPIQIADFSYENLLKNNWESSSSYELKEFIKKYVREDVK